MPFLLRRRSRPLPCPRLPRRRGLGPGLCLGGRRRLRQPGRWHGSRGRVRRRGPGQRVGALGLGAARPRGELWRQLRPRFLLFLLLFLSSSSRFFCRAVGPRRQVAVLRVFFLLLLRGRHRRGAGCCGVPLPRHRLWARAAAAAAAAVGLEVFLLCCSPPRLPPTPPPAAAPPAAVVGRRKRRGRSRGRARGGDIRGGRGRRDRRRRARGDSGDGGWRPPQRRSLMKERETWVLI